MHDPEDPLAALILVREPHVKEEHIAVVAHEWWSLYGKGFEQLGILARELHADLRTRNPTIIALEFVRILAATEESVRLVLATFPELVNRIEEATSHVITRDQLRELFTFFMRLGRIPLAG